MQEENGRTLDQDTVARLVSVLAAVLYIERQGWRLGAAKVSPDQYYAGGGMLNAELFDCFAVGAMRIHLALLKLADLKGLQDWLYSHRRLAFKAWLNNQGQPQIGSFLSQPIALQQSFSLEARDLLLDVGDIIGASIEWRYGVLTTSRRHRLLTQAKHRLGRHGDYLIKVGDSPAPCYGCGHVA